MPDSIFARLHWLAEDASQAKQLPPSVQCWLFDKQSLTVKLKRACTRFDVKVRSEKWIEKTFENETALLPTEAYWCREVLLFGDGIPWVEARTLIPKALLAHYQDLSTLGNKPIGEWLFQQAPNRQLIQWAQDPQSGLYARRSLFLVQNMPLLISELFLENRLISE
ncbi:4-hydroxybenzoate synthetase/chorismate--pyruvate lyase [Aggregatibacter actinomycetemcomitans serotype e str. SC1083]|uniref:Probable chorismate pyruvate-lyase n=1 Tax=Aggregatibacter actinomycetemcomitans serotype e str. SC1083 TaxID=907488 RepID=G4A6M2_AGGAC|nr:chorismate lyase [Aggregatibacter actinomycetemcomitans]EGY34759.1 4-hydroxybenzoate synthetase/chorismate--pyruvate lyase [Aggregatibacter actinomycetemcomitans serotype e str. SC1083]KYK76007.1 chorismate--pyruvate lyase [Aggregatibacter actinomycetemcomitans serotype e str. SA3096]KYK81772.1 chorismate--pyruvate lyase [Aggregatibacter actinomycetemcomitans serotype e str. SC936]KYK94110.1 chorismate--pyruvate lyase [Aggregatibacter actinomycetemcomitans serotype e str. ANH9776]TYB21772.1